MSRTNMEVSSSTAAAVPAGSQHAAVSQTSADADCCPFQWLLQRGDPREPPWVSALETMNSTSQVVFGHFCRTTGAVIS